MDTSNAVRSALIEMDTWTHALASVSEPERLKHIMCHNWRRYGPINCTGGFCDNVSRNTFCNQIRTYWTLLDTSKYKKYKNIYNMGLYRPNIESTEQDGQIACVRLRPWFAYEVESYLCPSVSMAVGATSPQAPGRSESLLPAVRARRGV